MPCCRCSTPTATPLVANGRDWDSCDSGWGRRVRLTAWLASPWSWRGEAWPGRAPGDGARGGARALARGGPAPPPAGGGGPDRRPRERAAGDLRPVAPAPPPPAASPPWREH